MTGPSPAAPGRVLVTAHLSGAAAAFLGGAVDLAALAAGLGRRGVALTATPDRADVVVTAGATLPATVATVSIAESWLPGRVRLAERPADVTTADDARLPRLLKTLGAGLDDDAISAACGSLTPDAAPLPPLAGFADWPPVPGGGTDRDRTRRILATEVIFNAPPTAPEPLAAALADAIRSVAPRPALSVSIAVVNHNYARFVGAAVDSALRQETPAREVIVIDDGSTDGSADLIAATPGITPILKANGGQASAFNAAFARTGGDVVLFLDADDRLRPDAVARIAGADLRGLARLSFGLALIDARGGPLGLHPTTRIAEAGQLAGPLAARGIFRFMPTSGNAFPRWALERLLPMPEAGWRISADLYLVLAAALLGPSAHLDEVLGDYRVHGENAYFQPLFAEPYLRDARMTQRARAWRDLRRRLPAILPPDEAERWRRRLRRLGKPERVGPVRPGGGLGRTTDPLEAGGRATWPLLGPGAELVFTARRSGPGALGHGWSPPGPQGARMLGRAASVGFRLPDIAADWQVTLDVALEGAAPLRGLEVWCGGTRIDTLSVPAGGPVELLVPAALVPWSQALDGRACALVLTVPAGEAGRLRLTGLAVGLRHGTGAPAPDLPPGVRLTVGPGRIGARCLGAGWGWPGADGAAVEAGAGRLTVSLAAHRDHVLTLSVDGARPAIAVNGTLRQPLPTCRDAALAIPVAAEEIPPDGRVALDILPLGGAEGGHPRLTAIRADVTGAAELLPLVPEVVHEAGALVGPGASGLRPDGPVARIVSRDVSLPLGLPPGIGQSRLVVRLAARSASGPVGGRLSAGAGTVRVAFARDAEVALDLPLSGSGALTLEIEAAPDAPDIAAVWLTERQDRTPRPRGPLPEAASAETLADLAEDGAAWHPPAEGALWLAVPSAALALPPPPPGTERLLVSVLVLPEPEQRLWLQLGAERRETSGPGPQELALPLPPDGGPLRLEVGTDLLVAPDLLGLGGTRPLGGALTGLRFGAAARRAPQSAEAS